METIYDRFDIDNGVELYRKDFKELEELLKYGDINNDYGTKYTNGNLFLYSLKIKKDGSDIKTEFGSIDELKSDLVSDEIEYLTIEKNVYEEEGMTKRIEISFNKNYVSVSISSDDFLWNKHKRLLIEDFFSKKKSKTGKINKWFITKGSWVNTILVGAMGGIGFGFKEPVFLIFAVAIFSFFTMISSPLIRNKLFPNNHIYLKPIGEDIPHGRNGKKKTSKFRKLKLYLTNKLIPQMIPSIAATIFIAIVLYIYRLFQ